MSSQQHEAAPVSPAGMDSSGVSVIVATYRGVEHIGRCLESLRDQALSPDRFEIVVVLNGPDDGTLELVRAFRGANPQLAVRVVRLPESGLALARNAGMGAAARDYVTFVDDDDRVSREYLQVMLEAARTDVIAVAQVADVDASGGGVPDFDTYVNRGTLKGAGQVLHPSRLPTAVSFDAAKIVRTELARSVPVDSALRSGSDVAYWTTLANTHALSIRVCDPGRHAVYYRSVRSDSHSRPNEMTFDFYIDQRLDVITRLDPIASDPNQFLHQGAKAIIAAQVGHMNRYLRQRPEEHEATLLAVSARGLQSFPYRSLNAGLGRDLVIAYSFLPANDTSAFVAARRIRERAVIVDVVSHDMSRVRPTDRGAMRIVQEYLDRSFAVPGPAVSARWRGVARFCREGMSRIEELELEKGRYRSVYSRAMWPASHVLAALYKVRNPDAPWTAEFSDPLLRDTRGRDRVALFPDDPLIDELAAGIRAAGFQPPATHNLYLWIEHLVYALADTVVFTNDNQRQYMLGYLADSALRRRAEGRYIVSAHPTPAAELYSAADTAYELDDELINIAYFGNFYPTRTLAEVTGALRQLPPEARARVRLHVFTNAPDSVRAGLGALAHERTVVANPLVPYLEFLRLSTMFDVLVVSDALTTEGHGINPYLPSKVSDYLGSGVAIWSIVEDGSPLSGIPTAFRSRAGDTAGARAVLDQLGLANPRAAA